MNTDQTTAKITLINEGKNKFGDPEEIEVMDATDPEHNPNDDGPTKPAPASVDTNWTEQAKDAATGYASQTDLVGMFVSSIITISK